jgi:hypothetical protein
VSTNAGHVFSASSLFSVTDADNDPLTYFLYDSTGGTSGGHFVVSGSAVPTNTVVALNAAQLAQTTYVAGAAGTSDALFVMAYDGHTYSGNTTFASMHVNVSASGTAPLAIASTAVASQEKPASDLLLKPTDSFVFARDPGTGGAAGQGANSSHDSLSPVHLNLSLANDAFQLSWAETQVVSHGPIDSAHNVLATHDFFIA